MATASEVSKVYVALYNRAIDAQTLSSHGGAYNSGMIQGIIDKDPTISSLSNKDFVELVYKNALGKDYNTDKAGIDYWVSQITSQKWSKGQLLEAIIKSSDDYALGRVPETTESKIGVQTFTSKAAISEKAASMIQKADSTSLEFGVNLDHNNVDNAIKALEGIAMRNPIAKPGGANVSLSTEAPNFIPGTAEASGAATKNDDTIKAEVGGSNTFKADTQIDADEGNDHLVVDMRDSFAGIGSGGFVKNVEQITLNSKVDVKNKSLNFDAKGIEGVYTYTVNGLNAINLNNISYNEYLQVNLNGVKSETGTKISFDTTPTGGKLAMNLNNVGYDSTDNSIKNHGIDVGNGIGQMQLHLTGTNFADILNEGVNRITVGGTGSLDTNLSRGVIYFNGSNATGDLTVRVGTAAQNGSNVSSGDNTGTDGSGGSSNGNTNGAINSDKLFEYFATGSGKDTVFMDVNRLKQDAKVDLGAGDDTLVLTGNQTVSSTQADATKKFYNLNTVENLVVNTTGAPLQLDLGTKSTTQEGESGSTTTTTQDRSANLKSITIKDKADASITSLGAKDLTVNYHGSTAEQSVLIDHSGTTNLSLGGMNTGNVVETARGSINLSNSSKVNIDLWSTKAGFEGYIKAAKATEVNITNHTADQSINFLAKAGGRNSDFNSVKTMNIDTESNSSAINTKSVDLTHVNLPQIANINLTGTGGVTLGKLTTNANALTINGSTYTGDLTTGDIFISNNGSLSLTANGGITTGNITAANVSIDLSGNNGRTDGGSNNDIGTIFLQNGTANGAVTLDYKTGISGTKFGLASDDSNEIQKIDISANTATLNLNGKDGVDRFDIVANSNVKNLTISGDLGSINRDDQKRASDSIKIDLSSTNGVNLNMSGLNVNFNKDANIGYGAVEITSSAGKDTLTLGAGSEVIEFSTGGGRTTEKAEVTTIDLADFNALEPYQTISFNGVTITSNGNGVLNQTQIAEAIKAALEGKKTWSVTSGTGTAAVTHSVSITGKLDVKNFKSTDWTVETVKATADTTAKITLTNKIMGDFKPNLEFTFSGLATSKEPAMGTTTAAKGAAGNPSAKGSAGGSALGDIAGVKASATAAPSKTYTITGVDGLTTIEITGKKGTGTGTGTTISAENITKIIAGIIEGTDVSSIIKATANGIASVKVGTEAYDFNKHKTDLTGENWTIAADGTTGKFKLTPTDNKVTESLNKISVNDGTKTATVESNPYTTDSRTVVTIEFKELKTGQSYSFNGKTVVATKDLSAEQVATAFTMKQGDTSIDGANILSNFAGDKTADFGKTDKGGVSVYRFETDGSKFIATSRVAGTNAPDPTTAANVTGGKLELTGTGAAATDKLAGTITYSTVDGHNKATILADSHITIGGFKAGSATEAGTATLNDTKLDTLSGFDSAVDKLKIKQFDPATGQVSDKLFGLDNVVGVNTNNQLDATTTAGKVQVSLANNTVTTNIYASAAADGAITGTLEGGIITFNKGTLAQKLAAVQDIGTNAIVGIRDGNDIYVVAGGADTNSTTDDVVIKLAGVGNTISDLSAILGA